MQYLRIRSRQYGTFWEPPPLRFKTGQISFSIRHRKLIMIGLSQKSNSQSDKEQSDVTERILNLTLEIIYLLTGEDYILVRTPGELVTPRNRPRVLEGWSRIRGPTMESPPPSVKDCGNRILEVTGKITELLAEEVPIRCHDVAVYLSMEELGYLDGHLDQYQAAMMENYLPFASLDGSTKRNPQGKCRCPLNCHDSTQEEPHAPKQYQDKETNTEEYTDRKEPKLDEETDVSKERILPERPPHPDSPRGSTSPELSTPEKGEEVLSEYQDENVILIKVEDDWGVQEEFLSEISADGQYLNAKCPASACSGQINNGITAAKKSTKPFHAAAHRRGTGRIPTQRSDRIKRPYSCAACGKCFAQKSSLGRHEKIHTGQYDHKCSHCEKSFTLKSYLVVHERVHTQEKPFACEVCGKRFNQKPNLLMHEKIHIKPYTCAECGKCFKHRSSFILHEQLSMGTEPYRCPQCGKCFSKKSSLISLISHERCHIGQKPS